MDRWVINLGTERDNTPFQIHAWQYFYVGDCDGDVTVRLGSPSSSAFNPEEFDKLTDVSKHYWMYVTNTAQSGKVLVIYFEESRRRRWI